MTRILIILSILGLSYFNCSAQTNQLKFDRMRIALCGDSLLTQQYELIIKAKKVNYITFVTNYLHVKGLKYRTRVKFNRAERKKIFNLVDQLAWTNLEKVHDKEINNKFFVVEQYSSEDVISHYKVPDELLPSDFKELFDLLSRQPHLDKQ